MNTKRYQYLSILGLMFFLASYLFVSDLVVTNSISNDNIIEPTRINSTEDWTFTWGGPLDEFALDVEFDQNGSIYLIGYTYSYGKGSTDLALVKLSPDGNKDWNITWGGSDHDRGSDLIFGSNGDIYVAGWTTIGGSDDFALIKIFPNGTTSWNVTWGGSGIDYGKAIGLSIDDFFYISGWTRSFGAGSYDFALVKFSLNGTLIWNVTWGGSVQDGSNDLALGPDGAIYLVGYTNSFGAGMYDIALLKYYPNGTLAWNVTWGGVDYDAGYEIIIGNDGYIYVVGETKSFGAGDSDLVFLKFNTDGELLFNVTWGGPSYDSSNDLVMDSHGNIYVIGRTKSYGAGNTDFAILNFNSNGNLIWSETWGSTDEEKATGIGISQDNYLYVCGYTNHSTAGGYDFLLVKYKSISSPSQSIPVFELPYTLLGFFILIYLVHFYIAKPKRLKNNSNTF